MAKQQKKQQENLQKYFRELPRSIPKKNHIINEFHKPITEPTEYFVLGVIVATELGVLKRLSEETKKQLAETTLLLECVRSDSYEELISNL